MWAEKSSVKVGPLGCGRIQSSGFVVICGGIRVFLGFLLVVGVNLWELYGETFANLTGKSVEKHGKLRVFRGFESFLGRGLCQHVSAGISRGYC